MPSTHVFICIISTSISTLFITSFKFKRLSNVIDNQILGFTHIGDFNGLSVSHITMWNPTEFGRILKWTEQSVPMRHKEIHLGLLSSCWFANASPWLKNLSFQTKTVNVGSGVKWVIDVSKSRTSKKMQERLQVHSCNDDLKKKFSPEVLPIEMGWV